MTDVITVGVITTFIAIVVANSIPLVLAATGETIGEQSGVLNLGIEGVMLLGGFVGFAAALGSGNIWIGMLAGALAGVVGNLALLILNVWFGLNQIVIGLAVLLIAEGITSVLYLQNYAQSPDSIPPQSWAIPGLSQIPVVGPAIFSQSGVFWVALVLVAVVAFFLARTNWGLAIRAAGQKPSSLDVAGGSVMRTRSQAVMLNGFFVGLGGAYLAILVTGKFTAFMTGGLGFVAIVIAMLSRGKMSWVLITSLIYGTAVAMPTLLQVMRINLPTDVFDMLPFVVIMATLVIFARRSVVPPALGGTYVRGAR